MTKVFLFYPKEKEKNNVFGTLWNKRVLFMGLAYLKDIFDHKTEVNLCNQNPGTTITEVTE